MENYLSNKKKLDQNKLLRFSSYFTVFGVSLIIIAKVYGTFITSSATMLASLIDSLLDVCVSIMNLITIHYSLTPPDHEHRFGHGKAEDLAVFIQSSFFGISGLYLIFNAIERLYNFQDYSLNNSNEGILILIFSITITLAIVIFQRVAMSKAKSKVIEADSLHYLTDFLTNICAIIAIFFASYFKINWFDSLAAILIACYIIFNAIKLFNKAFKNLMDHELEDSEKQLIVESISSHSQVLGFHDLKTRYAGVKPFIQFHIELDENMTIKQAHKIAHEIEEKILLKMPNAEILIHQDPAGIEEKVFYKD